MKKVKVKFGWRISAINKLTKEREWISSVGEYDEMKRNYDKLCKTKADKRPWIYPRMKYVPYNINELRWV